MEPSVLLGPAIALLVYGAISRRASRGGLTPPMWFLLVGWVLGSGALGLITLPVDSAAVSTLAASTWRVSVMRKASRFAC